MKYLKLFEEYNMGNSSLRNIRILKEDSSHILYNAEFGFNGMITWEVNRENDEFIIVQSMNRNKDSNIAPKTESKGEGRKAIASLFDMYQKIISILYDDESEGFWTAIGGDVDELTRDDFYNYYENS
jgi:hypothetical protein